jgi:hypothetical protein
LPELNIGGDTGAAIRSASNAGQEVTSFENPITVYGWTGYAYSIVDPQAGAGAYLIDGSGNG